nr:hypothetical protein [Rickettsia conorii]
MLNKVGTHYKIDWNMGEFFIIARFQNKGVGRQVAKQIWQMHKRLWEVAVIPENKPALNDFKAFPYTSLLSSEKSLKSPTPYIYALKTSIILE